MLPNGLAVYGASRGDVRFYQLIRDYFESGIDVRPGMTVVDAGANIGMFALEVLQRSDGDVNLLAYEPAPDTFADLERNLRALFPSARARAFPCALGARSGEATLYHRPRAPVLSSLYSESLTDRGRVADAMLRQDPPVAYRDVLPGWFRRLPRPLTAKVLERGMRRRDEAVVETRCIVKTVSEVIREHGLETIDLLKIDVEGSELDVLHGIEAPDWPKLHEVVLEVHDIDGRLAVVVDLLERAGFARVATAQEWLFDGTNVHMVSAGRA